MGGYYLNDNDRDVFQQLASSRTRSVRPNWYKRRRSSKGSAGTSSSTSKVVPVKITTEIASATIDVTTGKITPATITVQLLARDSGGEYNASNNVSFEDVDVISLFKTFTPDPGDGKWRMGYIDQVSKELVQRECEVFEEPLGDYSGS